jgi:hypothetical protein
VWLLPGALEAVAFMAIWTGLSSWYLDGTLQRAAEADREGHVTGTKDTVEAARGE